MSISRLEVGAGIWTPGRGVLAEILDAALKVGRITVMFGFFRGEEEEELVSTLAITGGMTSSV